MSCQPGLLMKHNLVLQPLCWCCAECGVHHEQNMCEEQHHMDVAQTSNNSVIAVRDLCCCLLPQGEALSTCCSGFRIAPLVVIYNVFHIKHGKLKTLTLLSDQTEIISCPFHFSSLTVLVGGTKNMFGCQAHCLKHVTSGHL